MNSKHAQGGIRTRAQQRNQNYEALYFCAISPQHAYLIEISGPKYFVRDLFWDKSGIVLSDVGIVHHQVRDLALSLLQITGPAEISDFFFLFGPTNPPFRASL